MRKYLKFFMLMLLVFSYSYSGVMPETDWKIKNLKGKVKSMVKTEYEYEKSEKIKFTSLVKTEFNRNGFIAKRIEEIPQKSLNNYKYSYKYSKDGNLIEKVELVEKAKGYYPMYDIINLEKK